MFAPSRKRHIYAQMTAAAAAKAVRAPTAFERRLHEVMLHFGLHLGPGSMQVVRVNGTVQLLSSNDQALRRAACAGVQAGAQWEGEHIWRAGKGAGQQSPRRGPGADADAAMLHHVVFLTNAL